MSSGRTRGIMTGKFAYSFDRETFQGAYDSRQQAVEAAMAALKDLPEMPAEGVFVGQWCEPDVHADDHAEHVVSVMRDRWNNDGSEEKFLENPTEQQLADLDYELARVIRNWLLKHDLQPRPTKVRAVSQHAIPNIAHVPQGQERETSVIGEV